MQTVVGGEVDVGMLVLKVFVGGLQHVIRAFVLDKIEYEMFDQVVVVMYYFLVGMSQYDVVHSHLAVLYEVESNCMMVWDIIEVIVGLFVVFEVVFEVVVLQKVGGVFYVDFQVVEVLIEKVG